jgi:isochorismate hydrolase
VIVTGISGDISVLFTANDAYMRDLKVLVPPDWIASEDPEKNRQVLTRMQRVLNAEIKPSVLASGEMKIAYHARSSAFVWNAYGLYANR